MINKISNELCKQYKISFLYLLIVISILISACGKKEDKISSVVEGKYVATDGSGYITAENYRKGTSEEFEEVVGFCDLQFFDVDLSSYEDMYLLNNATNYIAINTDGNLSDDEIEDIKDMLRANIDIKNNLRKIWLHFLIMKITMVDTGSYVK